MNASRWKPIPLAFLFVLVGPALIQTLLAADPMVIQTTRPTLDRPLPVQEFASPSGTYRLVIRAETLTRLRDAPAIGSKSCCRFMCGPTVLWEKTLPFVMSNVIVTDQGKVIGASFESSVDDVNDRMPSLFLIILDETGERLLCEKHTQTLSSRFNAPLRGGGLLPVPFQISVSQDLDRVVFGLHEATTDRIRYRDVVFRVHELSTGDHKAIVRYEKFDPHPRARTDLETVIPVATPELLMFHYIHSNWPKDRKDFKYRGESMDLVDMQGNLVWQRWIDYGKIDKDPRSPFYAVQPRHVNCASITSTKSGFVIAEAISGKKGEYHVSKEKTGWVVSEVKSELTTRPAK